MGMISSKNQIVLQSLPRSPPLTYSDTVESGVSVCHHMLSLLANGNTEVRQTALQVLKQLTSTSATNLFLDRDCVERVGEAILRVLKGGSAAVTLETLLISLEILSNVFPHLGENLVHAVCKDKDVDDLLSKLGQLGLVGAELLNIMRIRKQNDLETPGDGLQLPRAAFGSTDIRYRENESISDRSSSQLDMEFQNRCSNYPRVRSPQFFPLHTCTDLGCDQQSQANHNEVKPKAIQGKSIRMMMKKMEDEESADLQAVTSAAAAGAQIQKFLMRGEKFPSVHGSRVELWMPEDPSFFSKAHLATLICGMLNSPFGGTIYMGILQDGTVKGLDVNRDGHDLLRRNLAKVMVDNITPTVLSPAKVSIDFYPVDCEDGTRSSVVVISIAEYPSCGIVWEAPRIYRARHLSMDLLDMEGTYLRMEGEGPSYNHKMEAMDIHKEQRKNTQHLHI